MRKNDPINHIMSDEIHTVQKGQAVSEAYNILHSNKVHHVPVLDGKKLVGIVSSSDLMKLSMGAEGYDSNQMWSYIDAQNTLVDVMTENPTTLSDGDVVRDAAQILAAGTYHSLPVTNDGGDLIGIVTSTDLIRYLVEQY